MKSLNNYISEKLTINKDFKYACSWANVTEFFSITVNNRIKTVNLVVSCITNEKQVHKKTNKEFWYKDVPVIANDGTREAHCKINNDKNILYSCNKREYYRFSEIIVHPHYANIYKELCEKLIYKDSYDFNFIIKPFGLTENDFPDNFFEDQKYKFDTKEEDIKEIIEYIEKRNENT